MKIIYFDNFMKYFLKHLTDWTIYEKKEDLNYLVEKNKC